MHHGTVIVRQHSGHGAGDSQPPRGGPGNISDAVMEQLALRASAMSLELAGG